MSVSSQDKYFSALTLSTLVGMTLFSPEDILGSVLNVFYYHLTIYLQFLS
jgi:hypothetical protein